MLIIMTTICYYIISYRISRCRPVRSVGNVVFWPGCCFQTITGNLISSCAVLEDYLFAFQESLSEPPTCLPPPPFTTLSHTSRTKNSEGLTQAEY